MYTSGRPEDAWQGGQQQTWHATTIVLVRKGGRTVIGGDGQVSLGQTIIKGNARKVRRLGKGGVIAGFAGATADAFALFERLEVEARTISVAAPSRVRRTRQGLAHGQVSAPARGDDAGCGPGGRARFDRHR